MQHCRLDLLLWMLNKNSNIILFAAHLISANCKMYKHMQPASNKIDLREREREWARNKKTIVFETNIQHRTKQNNFKSVKRHGRVRDSK